MIVDPNGQIPSEEEFNSYFSWVKKNPDLPEQRLSEYKKDRRRIAGVAARRFMRDHDGYGPHEYIEAWKDRFKPAPEMAAFMLAQELVHDLEVDPPRS